MESARPLATDDEELLKANQAKKLTFKQKETRTMKYRHWTIALLVVEKLSVIPLVVTIFGNKSLMNKLK